MSEPEITRLENGMTVATIAKQTEQPYICLTVGVGSRDEASDEAGISHFLEHMLASDTEFHTETERALLVQRMRGISNAATDYEDTCYYYQVNKAHIAGAMKLLADGIQHPLMSEDKIEKERGAILAEMRADFSDPEEIQDLLFMHTAFAGSSLENSIGGTLKNIAGFSKQDLLDFMKRHYTSDNMVMMVVGDVDHSEICKLTGEIFNSLPRSHEPRQVAPAHYRGGQTLKNDRDSDEITFTIGFPTAGTENHRTGAKNLLLENLIAGEFNSKLMRALRSDTGLVYSVNANTLDFRGLGVFTIEAGIESGNAKEAIKIMCKELREASHSITQEDLDAVRDMLAGEAERDMENTELQGDVASSQLIHQGHFISPQALLETLESITLEEIQTHAAETFSGVPAVAALGSGVNKIPSYEKITRWLGQERKLDATGLALETAPSANRRLQDAALTASPTLKPQRSVA